MRPGVTNQVRFLYWACLFLSAEEHALGKYALLLNGSKKDMTNNNDDSLWEGRARRLEMNLSERTLPDTFVSDGHLRQIYDPQSNNKNQLLVVRQPDVLLPVLYLRAMGFPIPLLYPPIIFQSPVCSHLPLFIRVRE